METVKSHRWIVLLAVLVLLSYFGSIWHALLIGIPTAAIMVGISVCQWLRRIWRRQPDANEQNGTHGAVPHPR
jgi:Na+-driven multidrug efflux pump